MAYKKDDLEILTVDSVREEYGLEPDEDTDGCIHDSRGSDIVLPVVTLPHSCDRWIIGSADNVRQLISDLTEALKTFEKK